MERELWGRAAARCQFKGCNALLYKSPVTQQPANLAQKAHIYSFSPSGPRGWGPFIFGLRGINDVPNLLLVCHGCHTLIDNDRDGTRYSAELLKRWKEEHETRVRLATGITANNRSHVVVYGSRIGSERSPLNTGDAFDAMFPDWYPADEMPIELSMQSSLDDSTSEFWIAEKRHLLTEFDRQIRRRIEQAQPNHFSVFALAPQPLLIQLGALFTEKVPVVVYQPIREPRTWRRQPHPDGFEFILNRPNDLSGPPVVLFALSDEVKHNRVHAAVGTKASIWEVTLRQCHNDFLRSEAQLADFRRLTTRLFVELGAAHPSATEIGIFPVMPVACAIELGRVRMPKAALPWAIYDYHSKVKQFAKRLTIGASDE